MTKCICCKKERELILNGWCQECLDALDEHLLDNSGSVE